MLVASSSQPVCQDDEVHAILILDRAHCSALEADEEIGIVSVSVILGLGQGLKLRLEVGLGLGLGLRLRFGIDGCLEPR